MYWIARPSGCSAPELVRLLSATSRRSRSVWLMSWSTPPRDPATATPSRRRMNLSVLPSQTDKHCIFSSISVMDLCQYLVAVTELIAVWIKTQIKRIKFFSEVSLNSIGMVQRITYRRRLSYNTKSNRVKKVRTPGGKLVFQYLKKRPQVPKCPMTGLRLKGVTPAT